MIAAEIIAHRGLSGLCPENTMIAIKAAAKLGVAWVEVDVQVLADGTPVLFHDYDMGRTTNVQGVISAKTSEEIEEVDVGSWFDARFESERIPLLQDALHLIDEYNLGLNLEIKYHKEYHDNLSQEEIKAMIKNIMSVIAISPPPPRGIFISSSFLPFLEEIRKCGNKINLAYLCEEYDDSIIKQAESINACAICISSSTLLEVKEAIARKRVEKIKKAELELYVYTVDNLPEAKMLFEFGVNGIFTDFPQSFKRYLP